MNQQFISKSNNQELVLFFNGWGMDEYALSDFNHDGFDVVMFNNYLDDDIDVSIIDGYRNVYVVAWSLGVWVANKVCNQIGQQIVKSVAINGTCKPVDDKYGIEENIFKGTIDGWDEGNRRRFQIRMFNNRQLYTSKSHLLPKRTCEDQKNELQAMYDRVKLSNTIGIEWDRVIIGHDDTIFSPSNLFRFWGSTHPGLDERIMPHFPFFEFNNWYDVLDIKNNK